MTKWKEMLHKEQKYLQELLNQLEKQEKGNLAGRLRISSDRGYPRYYHCKGGDKWGEYISKKNLELARQLAQKEYDVIPTFWVEMVVITGILNWDYQIQLYIGK